MSLYCDESKQNIGFGTPLFAGTREDVNFFSALCEEVINRIPKEERRVFKTDKEGVNIHRASSGRNFNEAYTLCDFSLGDFLFSISKKSAEKYLPAHFEKYP
jgi:hypothetical protein